MATLASDLGTFVSTLTADRLPADIVDKAKACLLNAYGMGLGCHDTPFAPVARRAAIAVEGEVLDGATMLADGRRTTIGGACLANSALFHGRAQEDSCGAAHFGTVLVPLLTAMIETGHHPASRLIPSLVAGYEVGGLFEHALAGATTPAGFRSTSTYGVIAAAAAASRMLELDPARTAAALSTAVSLTGGVLQSFADGTDEWRYQPGIIAHSGLTAAQLARAGAIAAPNAFEGNVGLARAFGRTECDVEAIRERIGTDWSMHRVAFKPFPVCAFNQTPVTAAMALRGEVQDAELTSVRVRMNPFECGYAGMDTKGPFSTVSGTLMSISFCIATTLVHGAPDLASMTTYDDPQVNALEDRITLVADASVPTLSTVIEAETADGRLIVRDQRMTPADYSYSRAEVSALVRRIGREQNVPPAAFDLVESFVNGLPAGDLAPVFAAFAMLERRHAVV